MMQTQTSDHETMDDAELDSVVAETLADVGTDLGELRRQAHEGRFASEKLRRAWFVIDGLGRG